MVRGWRGSGGDFRRILEHFQDLQARGPPRGNFPEPKKSILVVVPRKAAREDDFFYGMGIKDVTEGRYLGGFFGNRVVEDSWLAEKVQG